MYFVPVGNYDEVSSHLHLRRMHWSPNDFVIRILCCFLNYIYLISIYSYTFETHETQFSLQLKRVAACRIMHHTVNNHESLCNVSLSSKNTSNSTNPRHFFIALFCSCRSTTRSSTKGKKYNSGTLLTAVCILFSCNKNLSVQDKVFFHVWVS